MWKRVIAPVLVVGIVWVIASTVSTLYIARIEQAQDQILVENIASIRAASDMEATLWRMQSLVLEGTRNEENSRHWDALSEEFLAGLSNAEAASKVADEMAFVARIREHFTKYADRGRVALRGGMIAAGITPQELLNLANGVAEPTQKLIELNDGLARAGTTRRQGLSAKLFWIRLLFLVFGLSLGLLLGYRIATTLHRSIMQISIRLKDAAGELQEEVGRLAIAPQADLPAVQRQVDVVAERIRKVLAELQEARQEAMRHERLAAVGGLAAGVAHELRNPLTSVKLLIQTAVFGPQRALDGKMLDVVLEEIGRMETTIQGLLDFARPPQLRRSLHDVHDTITRAINLTEGRAKQHHVSLDFVRGHEPILVNGDPEQLHQVFVNLLLNGIESMAQGGTLQIEAEHDPANDLALIRFNDSGTGIQTPILPRLFEPFATTKERGTGLGLAVSRRIVQEHSGRLTATNRPEGGAQFTVELPLAQMSPQSQDNRPKQLVAMI